MSRVAERAAFNDQSWMVRLVACDCVKGYTSFAWIDRLRPSGVRISMDGKGRLLDNIFVERLWRSLKNECVYLQAWETGSDARARIRKWVGFYNHRRPNSAHGGKPPAMVYWLEKSEMQPGQQERRVA